jgi:hypothetical protein
MKITVQTISGNNRVISVEPTTTIRQIKEQLFSVEGIRADQQNFLYNGVIIKDTNTIESSNISDGDVIHMVLNIHGGF